MNDQEKHDLEIALERWMDLTMRAAFGWASQQLANMTGMAVETNIKIEGFKVQYKFTPCEEKTPDNLNS